MHSEWLTEYWWGVPNSLYLFGLWGGEMRWEGVKNNWNLSVEMRIYSSFLNLHNIIGQVQEHLGNTVKKSGHPNYPFLM